MYAANSLNSPLPGWDRNRVVLSGGTTIDLTRAATRSRSRYLGALVEGLLERVGAFIRQRRTVRELSALDDRTLADLGISRSDIKAIATGVYVACDARDGYRLAGTNVPANHGASRDVAA